MMQRRKNRFWWITALLITTAVAGLPFGPQVGYSQSFDKSLRLYGFFDLELEASGSEAHRGWTFDQHHFNVISVYRIDPQFRVLAEVDWEHGPSQSSSEQIGKIYLAKAYLEYKFSDALRFKAGKFLTPFGIYNERHNATPTFISTQLPHSIYGKHDLASDISDRLFAKFGTGVQALGRLRTGVWDWKYHVYLSNGRGENPHEADDNTNKAVGGRLVSTYLDMNLSLGVSVYAERNGLDQNTKQVVAGSDIEFEQGPVHAEAEAILSQFDAADFHSSRTAFGWYVLGAYTLYDRFTPFARFEWFDNDKDGQGHTLPIRKTVLGLNYAATASVAIKSEVHLHKGAHDEQHGTTPERYDMFLASIAVAF